MRPALVNDDDVPDQTDLWLARLESSLDRIAERLSSHETQPWHVSYKPMQNDLMKRLDRLENVVISMGKWVIGILAGILAAISAILVVAWRILESKPPGA